MTHARAEAFERLGGRYDVRVLEPSPPAMSEPPLFADDPVDGGEIVPLDRPGTRSWDELCALEVDAELSEWCAARWLGPWKRLSPLPGSFVATQTALHTVAEHVLAPARQRANGKIGLRFTRDGFGTPFFGHDRQVRVERGDLVVEREEGLQRAAITTLGDAARFVGLSAGEASDAAASTTAFDAEQVLAVDPQAAQALGDWYGFCASVLEQLRAEATDASLVQLWPEHFDLAVDLGAESSDQRANYGGSPGDDDHVEPYLYVGPWKARQGEFWNEAFGASLSYGQLLASVDQRQTALSFLRRGRTLLAESGSR